jgi:predicted small metal-binding protein
MTSMTLKEASIMSRKYIDCRDHPQGWGSDCTIEISSDSEEELIEAAVQHAVAVHGHSDTPEFRSLIRENIKDRKSG